MFLKSLRGSQQGHLSWDDDCAIPPPPPPPHTHTQCPKTVENFTTHAKDGYYDGIIFHRVIKGFMLQTGDPLGARRLAAPRRAAPCDPPAACTIGPLVKHVHLSSTPSQHVSPRLSEAEPRCRRLCPSRSHREPALTRLHPALPGASARECRQRHGRRVDLGRGVP